MKPIWAKFLNNHWRNRSAEERRAWTFFTLIAFPLLTYFLLWQPAHNAVNKLRNSIPVMRAQAMQIQLQANEVSKLRQQSKPAILNALALKSTIETTAVRYQIQDAITTIDLQEPNAVRIVFTSVAFDPWLKMLDSLQQEQHVRAESVSVAALPQKGLVRINATLSNGGM